MDWQPYFELLPRILIRLKWKKMCSSLREGRSQHNHRYGTEKYSSTVSVFKSNQPSNFWPQEKIWNLSTTNKKIIFAFKNVINLSLITHCVFFINVLKCWSSSFTLGVMQGLLETSKNIIVMNCSSWSYRWQEWKGGNREEKIKSGRPSAGLWV